LGFLSAQSLQLLWSPQNREFAGLAFSHEKFGRFPTSTHSIVLIIINGNVPMSPHAEFATHPDNHLTLR
jgi:hypothetical protein